MTEAARYRDVVAAFLDLDTLLAQLITALGLAMVFGNGFAMYKHSRGETPEFARATYRPGRARWLLIVGSLISVWGLVSLFG